MVVADVSPVSDSDEIYTHELGKGFQAQHLCNLIPNIPLFALGGVAMLLFMCVAFRGRS
jgi:hypothetical protein